ncbi:Endo-1,4-beta-xylanase A precursor [Acidisarcina polymorpha]|uniref:Endo-1,4-beta-xylanase A n=1 Tax=Acidisarcina polymorpha TaxID=2211140 RepID=A0A2Z5G0Q4_9BACT|nr:malectin domain-containing carbohydrate-binding protein [Acidisarcina polymorpha]AXC12580.1 Endo-1,4-beta-xylanase A precursor [Acidisarcina polymorpha]
MSFSEIPVDDSIVPTTTAKPSNATPNPQDASLLSLPQEKHTFDWRRLGIATLFVAAFALVGLLSGTSSASGQNSTIFGPNVYVFTPSDSVSSINATLNTLNANTQFSTNRYAVLFAPGTYTGVEAEVGFYESVAGLGETPSAVTISNGYLTSNQTDSNGNLTTNFWRSLENMSITPPSGDLLQWGVSQGADFRRMYVNGGMELTNTYCGEASGGFISDSQVTGNVGSCSQQQWYTRNSSIGSWSGNLWNMVFSGVSGAPAQSNPFGSGTSYTVLPTTPVSREKPFLYMDSSGNYWVFSPSSRTSSSGTSWSSGGLGAGASLAISSFFIATPSSTLSQINAALAAGKNLILTPGIYQYSGSINVTNANTVVLGLGYANLVPQSGTAAISVADVDGVQIAGLLIDAGPVNSPVLFEAGVAGASRVSHASNPTSISDVFFRIGGAVTGTATTSLEIDSDNVILDNIWAWRADHGNAPTGWTINVGEHGLVVNGDNVTALGLAVEHYEQNQVVWNGEGGETIFYQSEMPYDVPSQSAWMDGSVDGYASYYVSPSVTSHTAYGLGVYSFFNQGVNIIANSGIAVPVSEGVTFHDAVTVFLSGSGQITYTIASDSPTVDNAGTTADSASYISYVTSYGGTAGSCSAVPSVPGNPSATATSASQISVAWGASTAGSSCSVSYSVYRSTTSGFTPSSANQIASNLATASYADSGLAASTTYHYVIEAADGAGASTASAQASATTPGSGGGKCSAVPSAPAGVTAAASSSSAIGISWSPVTPPANCSISAYSIYGSTASGFTPSSSTLLSNSVTGTSYSNTGLSASTTYYYVIEATDADGTSTASAQASAETSAATSGTEVVAINSGGPVVSNSGGGDASFVADKDFTGGGTAVTANTITTAGVANAAPTAVYQTERSGQITYTIPGLTAGASYTVLLHFAEFYWTAAGKRVFNVSINGTSVLSNFDIYALVGPNKALVEQFTATANSSGQIVIAYTNGTADQPKSSGIEIKSSSAATCSTVPGSPTGLTATATSSSAIGLTWTAVTPPANCSISAYKVYGSTTSGFTPSTSNLLASVSNGTAYSNTGLAASTTYYYVVEAVDADGTSAASNQASAKTAAATCSAVPAAPTGLTATASSSSVISLSWAAVTPPANCSVSSYKVYGSTTSGFTPSSSNLLSGTVTGTSYSNTGLAASTTYYYVVDAADADGTSAASTQAAATTQAASGAEIVAIAAGGPAESNSTGGDYAFVADQDFSGGGDNQVSTAAINLTQPGANAAPMAVYQHARAGTSTYTIPGLTSGAQYTVLLHFAETYFTAAGDRVFNVAINGTSVLSNFDIYATVGVNAALVKQFTATANSSGDIVIAFTNGTANQPIVSGIEIR